MSVEISGDDVQANADGERVTALVDVDGATALVTVNQNADDLAAVRALAKADRVLADALAEPTSDRRELDDADDPIRADGGENE